MPPAGDRHRSAKQRMMAKPPEKSRISINQTKRRPHPQFKHAWPQIRISTVRHMIKPAVVLCWFGTPAAWGTGAAGVSWPGCSASCTGRGAAGAAADPAETQTGHRWPADIIDRASARDGSREGHSSANGWTSNRGRSSRLALPGRAF